MIKFHDWMKTLQSTEGTVDWESAFNWSGCSEQPIEYNYKPRDEQDDDNGEDDKDDNLF